MTAVITIVACGLSITALAVALTEVLEKRGF